MREGAELILPTYPQGMVKSALMVVIGELVSICGVSSTRLMGKVEGGLCDRRCKSTALGVSV